MECKNQQLDILHCQQFFATHVVHALHCVPQEKNCHVFTVFKSLHPQAYPKLATTAWLNRHTNYNLALSSKNRNTAMQMGMTTSDRELLDSKSGKGK